MEKKAQFCGLNVYRDRFGRGDWIFAGDHYGDYCKYRSRLNSYHTDKTGFENGGIVINVNIGSIEGIRNIAKEMLKNPNLFWGQGSGMTLDDYMEIAKYIPEVRNALNNGVPLSTLIGDPTLGKCASMYFDTERSDFPTVYDCNGFYEFAGDSANSLVAAKIVGCDVPVKVVGKIVRNEHDAIVNDLSQRGVNNFKIERLGSGEKNSNFSIISRLAGGDKTAGSCSSLAFAYVGNVAGYNVLDFRGGKSLNYFSNPHNIELIASLPDVESHVIYGSNDFNSADELLSSYVKDEGKEYYLAVGHHAAIVRKFNGHYEYLELQSGNIAQNRWHLLTSREQDERFGCDVRASKKRAATLIEVESLSRSQEFLDILGFINTASDKQKKGVDGYAK